MKSLFAATLVAFAFSLPAHAVAPNALIGTWEAARGVDDERMYVRFMEKGKAQIVAEYDFQIPGAPGKRRGRSTTYGKWSVTGDDVVVSYAKVRDRLRYSDKQSLSDVGRDGSAPGLKPTGKIDPNSKVRVMLWKAPHDFKLKAAAGTAPSANPAPAAEPAK